MDNVSGVYAVRAEYKPSLVYSGNPLIEALPEQLTLKQLHNALYNMPLLPADYVEYPPADRLSLLDKLLEIYLPMNYMPEIYLSVFRGIRSAYNGRSRVEKVKQLNRMGRAIETHDPYSVPDIGVQAQSFSILGDTGMGKTTTINKILSLIPQVIIHTEYKGKPFNETQVTYIRIECPGQDSPKGVCIQILQAMDEVLGTNLREEETRKNSNVDMLIVRISAVCVRFNVGTIVIDEIQNIIPHYRKVIGNIPQVVKFLVELSNKTGVCLLCIGLPQVGPFFDSEPHLLTRTRGPRIQHLKNDDTFYSLLNAMWSILPVLNPQPLTDEIRNMIYQYSLGTIRLMQTLLTKCAEKVIEEETEKITADTVRLTAVATAMPTKQLPYTGTAETTLLFSKQNSQSDYTKKFDKIMSNEMREVTRGRPTAVRDKDDLLAIFAYCQNNGIDTAQHLISIGLAEEII